MVGNAQHIKVSEVPNKAIWAQNAVTCCARLRNASIDTIDCLVLAPGDESLESEGTVGSGHFLFEVLAGVALVWALLRH
ncbi:hypothetical protein B296_00054155 [Ensete ventricosum]|uniref:Uncharacterized protein n=1 Tax=Ensete ventricosum TaxID=4639 RepID=A0A426Y512_ENSVE|nr:hypothetical protein B296_00054155 [Ensete ventricosum]